MQSLLTHDVNRVPWNKGKYTGQKPPLKRNEIWAICVRLQILSYTRKKRTTSNHPKGRGRLT